MADPDDSLRVSDAERDVTLALLGDHAAVGRLTLDELEDRSGRALAAKTRGELAALTSDLPPEVGQSNQAQPNQAQPNQAQLAQPRSAHPRSAQAQSAQPAPKRPVRWMVAIMSGSHRRGRFRAVGRINAIAIMGADEIDLREAEMEGGELTLNLFAFMGGADVYVPDSVELEVGGFSLMGGYEERGSQRPPRPGAPLVRINVHNLMGGATIYRLPPQARGQSLKESRRLAKLAERGELPPPDDPPALP